MLFSDRFLAFLTETLKNIPQILGPFWFLIKAWWWVVLPFILYKPLVFLWLWWRRDVWSGTQPFVMLEVRIPRDIQKPVRAMEQVFAGIHALHDVVVWREKWIEGQFQLGISLEIVSTNGQARFYIRVPKSFRAVLEANVYSQFPEVELVEVDDYVKNVPQDMPNKGWDLFGFDFISTKPDCYPIKTYKLFETEREETEEKKVDPLANLLEGLTILKDGEQLWIQIRATPIREEIPWVQEGREIIDELVRREKPKKSSNPLLLDALNVFISGKPPSTEEEEKEAVIPPEMKLTPGERHLVESIEEKITKFGYNCSVRFIYLGKRDVFMKARARIPYSFFKEISYEGVGGLKPWKVTAPKVKTVFLWFLDKRREYIRKRRLFRRYTKRMPPLFPMNGGTFVLNSEELATLFHFPSRGMAPAPMMPRIEAKKREAPPELPME